MGAPMPQGCPHAAAPQARRACGSRLPTSVELAVGMSFFKLRKLSSPALPARARV